MPLIARHSSRIDEVEVSPSAASSRSPANSVAQRASFCSGRSDLIARGTLSCFRMSSSSSGLAIASRAGSSIPASRKARNAASASLELATKPKVTQARRSKKIHSGSRVFRRVGGSP